MAPLLPPHVTRFIVESIESVEQLDVLLLLRASAPNSLSPEQVAQTLGVTPASVWGCMASLHAARLLSRDEADGSFRYHPASGMLGQLVEALEAEYRERRAVVVTAIAQRERPSVHAFAEAFRLRWGKS